MNIKMLMLLLVGCFSIVADAAEPALRVSALSAPEPNAVPSVRIPLIDAILETAGSWERVPVNEIRFPEGNGDAVQPDARFQIAHCNGRLYIRIVYDWISDAQPKTAAPGSSDSLWLDDGIELLFCADGRSPAPAVRQLIFNLAGARWSGIARLSYGKPSIETGWRPDWELDIQRVDGAYVALLSLPIREVVGVNGEPGDGFRFNIIRNRVGAGDLSSLFFSRNPGGPNADPGHYAYAVLVGGPGAHPETPINRALQSAPCLDGDAYSVRGLECVVSDPLILVPRPETVAVFLAAPDAPAQPLTPLVPIPSFPARVSASDALLDEIADRTVQLFARRLDAPDDPAVPLSRPFTVRHWERVVAAADPRITTEGNARRITYPRTIGSDCFELRSGSRLTFRFTGASVNLRFPVSFQTPSPYPTYLHGKVRAQIDGGDWTDIVGYDHPREVVIGRGLDPLAEHTVVIEPVAAPVAIDGFRISARPLSRVTGAITSAHYQTLLVDARADIYDAQTGSPDSPIRTEYIRNPLNGRFSIDGLAPGDYRIRLRAYGWRDETIGPLSIRADDAVVDVGSLFLSGDREIGLFKGDSFAPSFGRAVSVAPGAEFRAVLPAYRDRPRAAQLVAIDAPDASPVALTIRDRRAFPEFRWTGYNEIHFLAPDDAPSAMYHLQLDYGGGAVPYWTTLPQAVCVRSLVSDRFIIAGCGHMNTWGQQTAEYLRKVAETAELAGARLLLVSNEVNAAYVSGALKTLNIPYATTAGNHTMGHWDDFFGQGETALDDGRIRVVTFGKPPSVSWAGALARLNERADATCRILLCYEAYVPQNVLTDGGVDLVFDGHSEIDQSALELIWPQGLSIRAPDQESLRMIEMTPDGLSDSMRDTPAPILSVPRVGPSPLRIAQTLERLPGAADAVLDEALAVKAVIINEYETRFPTGCARFATPFRTPVVRQWVRGKLEPVPDDVCRIESIRKIRDEPLETVIALSVNISPTATVTYWIIESTDARSATQAPPK